MSAKMFRTTAPGADSVAAVARRHPSLVVLARTGWIAKGVVYALVGVLAMIIAFQPDGAAEANAEQSGEQASQSGAIARIAESAGGPAVLWLVAIGLLLYVVWRVASILLPAENSASAWGTRAGYAVSALTYTALAWVAISFARHGAAASGETEDSRVDRFTRTVMENAAGRWLVGLLGVAFIGIAAYFARRGVTADFRDELSGGVGPISNHTLVQLGRIGWCGRAAMMALVGFFLVRAAVQFSPDEAEGLDGALRRLAGTSWGTVVVVIIGAGLLVYGAYCVISAPVQRLKGAS